MSIWKVESGIRPDFIRIKDKHRALYFRADQIVAVSGNTSGGCTVWLHGDSRSAQPLETDVDDVMMQIREAMSRG